MKRTSVVLLCLILLVGCMKEDNSNCPDPNMENLLLRFEYVDREGKSKIDTHIDLIDVVFFDEQFRYYNWVTTSVDRLDENHTLKLNMEQGNYYVVAWGNIHSDRQQITGLDGQTIAGTGLYHTQESSADPLFYAPDLRSFSSSMEMEEKLFRVQVEPKKTAVYTMPFMGAHHIVEIYLKGFPEIKDHSLPLPRITATNFADAYDFLMQPGQNTKQFTRTAEYYTSPEKEELGAAVILVPHFKKEDNITINISGTTSTDPYQLGVTMQKILEELDIELADGENQLIEVVLTFDGIGVTVSQPSWRKNNSGGGIAG